MEKEDVLRNVNYDNIAKPIVQPPPVDSIDTDGEIYDDIINGYQDSSINVGILQNFSTISQARDRIYGLIDVMAEDPIISIALDIYTSDACARNSNGQIVWCESTDGKTQATVNYLLNKVNIDKYVRSWMYNLIKYGDVYLRLYRESDVNEEPKEKAQLNEKMVLKAYSKRDKYAGYVEMQKNPAEMFELYKFGKSAGYVRAHIQQRDLTDKVLNYHMDDYNYMYNLGDVDIYSAMDYVHGCVEDNSNRAEERISISQNEAKYTYNVRRGRSMLCNIYKIWRTLTLLENSVLLNRLTQSSIVRIISVEIGDMEQQEARKLKWRLKQFIEQKASIDPGNDFNEYLNTGALINTIYNTTRDGVGDIKVDTVGGDVTVGDLVDLDYFKNKLYGSLGIPKQYLGDTDDATGFNGGTSLALTSSRYATNVKLYQTIMCQTITDMMNLMLLDIGAKDSIGRFKIKMQAPMTIEEKDRQENLSQLISGARDVLDLFSNAGIEDNLFKLKVLRSLLPGIVSDSEILTLLSDEIEKLENEGTETEQTEDEFGFDDMSMESEPYESELPQSQEFNLEQEAQQSQEFSLEEPEQSQQPIEAEAPTEERLPTFEDEGVSYNEV